MFKGHNFTNSFGRPSKTAGNRQSRYSPVDPQFLGFQSYKPRQRREGFPTQKNSSDSRKDAYDYSYRDSDFPGLHNPISNNNNFSADINQDYSTSLPQSNGFLELLKAVQEMQSTQQIFQQELMSLKQHFPPAPRTQAPILPPGFYQHPTQAQQTGNQEPHQH